MQSLLESHDNVLSLGEKLFKVNEQLLSIIEKQREEIRRLKNNPYECEKVEMMVSRIIRAAFDASAERPSPEADTICQSDMEKRVARKLSIVLKALRFKIWLSNAQQREKYMEIHQKYKNVYLKKESQ